MNTCSISEFMKILTPWLSSDYLLKVTVNEKGHVILLFTDGIQNIYDIEDCTVEQLKEILDDLEQKGISVTY